MKWLVDQLAAASGYIDLAKPADRQLLADAIFEAIPRAVVAEAIRGSALAVLRCYGATGVGPGIRAEELAREIGNNAAHTALVLLQVDVEEVDPANELAIPEPVTP